MHRTQQKQTPFSLMSISKHQKSPLKQNSNSNSIYPIHIQQKPITNSLQINAQKLLDQEKPNNLISPNNSKNLQNELEVIFEPPLNTFNNQSPERQKIVKVLTYQMPNQGFQHSNIPPLQKTLHNQPNLPTNFPSNFYEYMKNMSQQGNINQQNMMVVAKTVRITNLANNTGNNLKKTDFNNNNAFKFYVGGGNNSALVRKIMEKREGWVETKESSTMFVHFKWQQSNRGYRYDRLVENQNYKQMVNHFEFHAEISNKQHLLKNLMKFCEQYKQNAFTITPLTFIIDCQDEMCEMNYHAFLKVYDDYLPKEMKAKYVGIQLIQIIEIFLFQKNPTYNNAKLLSETKRKIRSHFTAVQQDRQILSYNKVKMPTSFIFKESSSYLWLLKPTFLNRGRGIHIFNDLFQFEKLISDYSNGLEEKQINPSKQEKEKIDFIKLNRDSDILKMNSELINSGVRIKRSSKKFYNPKLANESQHTHQKLTDKNRNTIMSNKSLFIGQQDPNWNTEKSYTNNQNQIDNPETNRQNIAQDINTLQSLKVSNSEVQFDQKFIEINYQIDSVPNEKTLDKKEKQVQILQTTTSPSTQTVSINPQLVSTPQQASQSRVKLHTSSKQTRQISPNRERSPMPYSRTKLYQDQNYNTNEQYHIKRLSMKNYPQSQSLQQKQGTYKPKEFNGNDYIRKQPEGPTTLIAHQFVIQKYIERPLLIHGRKFDIRVWVLVTHDLDCYFFKQGYIRTSSEAYTCNENTMDNQFIHLTNNAIQQYEGFILIFNLLYKTIIIPSYSQNYQQFEDGNQLSYGDFDKYLELYYPESNVRLKQIHKRMKDFTWISLLSVKNKINQENRKHCFEIFGYDFILDDDFNTWLIEVNTNPCIEEASPLLEMLLPRMLDDGFKLTIDVIFNKNKAKQNVVNNAIIPDSTRKTSNHQSNKNPFSDTNIDTQSEVHKPKQNEPEQTEYPVIGYRDEENMWESLGNLKFKVDIHQIEASFPKINTKQPHKK